MRTSFLLSPHYDCCRSQTVMQFSVHLSLPRCSHNNLCVFVNILDAYSVMLKIRIFPLLIRDFLPSFPLWMLSNFLVTFGKHILWTSLSLSWFAALGKQFCAEEVVRMDSEADHLQITALVDALGVPVSVLNIDSSPTLSSSGTLEANQYDFFPHSSLQNQPSWSASTGGNGASMSNASARRRPHVTLLYRPGHYDILYPK